MVEALHNGVREFLIEFDKSIWGGRRADNVARTTVFLRVQYAILKSQDQRAIEYFPTIVAEYFKVYFGHGFEVDLFKDASGAYTDKLDAISRDHDTNRLLLLLTSLLHFAQRSRNRGREYFLNIIPVAYLTICQGVDDDDDGKGVHR